LKLEYQAQFLVEAPEFDETLLAFLKLRFLLSDLDFTLVNRLYHLFALLALKPFHSLLTI
jgi:hypothetical protein